jgi:hypothetical protein
VRSALELGLCALLVSLDGERPVFAVLDEADSGFAPRLPAERLDIDGDPTLELALRRQVRSQLGIDVGYVEQLYTFGDRDRDARTAHGWPRSVTVAYLALVRGMPALAPGARWAPLYTHLPWEDARCGLSDLVDEGHLRCISSAAPEHKREVPASATAAEGRDLDERAAIALPRSLGRWDEYRVLERYELLFELGLVAESGAAGHGFGEPLALDHRRVLATALGRLRGKLRYRPVVFEFLDTTFTLFQLQRVVEAIAGVRLHKQNFRRLVERGGLVEATGEVDRSTGGRPAARFRFRQEVRFERQAPGIGIPRGGG